MVNIYSMGNKLGQLETVTKWVESGLFTGKLLDYLLKRQEQLKNNIKKGA